MNHDNVGEQRRICIPPHAYAVLTFLRNTIPIGLLLLEIRLYTHYSSESDVGGERRGLVERTAERVLLQPVMLLAVPVVLAVLLSPISTHEVRRDVFKRHIIQEDYKDSLRQQRPKLHAVLHDTERQCLNDCLVDCYKSAYSNMTLWLCQFPRPTSSHSPWNNKSTAGEKLFTTVTIAICVIFCCMALMAVSVCFITTYRRVSAYNMAKRSPLIVRHDEGGSHKASPV